MWRHTPYVRVHMEGSLATPAFRVRASLPFGCIIEYTVASGKKAHQVFQGTGRSRYFVGITRQNILDASLSRELGTFFQATLRLVLRDVVAPTIKKKNVNEERKLGMRSVKSVTSHL